MRNDKFIHRTSVGFTQLELDLFEEALKVWNGCSEVTYPTLGARDRTRLIRCAIWAFCNAVIRQGASYTLACDLRHETKEEMEKRVGEDRAAEIAEASAQVCSQVQLNNRLRKYLDGGLN